MNLADRLSRLLGLLPLRFPRALGGLDDRLRAMWLVRGAGPCDITVVRRPIVLKSNLLVFELRRDPGNVVVKRSRIDRAAASVIREWDILRQLADDDRLEPWRALLPQTVGPRPHGPSPTLVQTMLTGVRGDELMGPTANDPCRAAAPALHLLAELREATGRHMPTTEWGGFLTETRLAILANEVRPFGPWKGAAALDALRHRMDTALEGAELTRGWTHGDYYPGNVLLSGQPFRVTGIFDWGNAQADGPCEIDACTFVLSLRSALTGRSLGELVADTLRTGRLPDPDRALLALAGVDPDRIADDPAALPLLTWLWHVAGNVGKTPRFGRSRWWTAGTVDPVVRESLRWATARF
ncbi:MULTISPECIES: phosphotransferase [unclassified Streptomyces]|uniref:phosphotransferase n=1 Tax=unclassified Streptomyces TaxID=2593676 RepID=UPI0033B441C3